MVTFETCIGRIFMVTLLNMIKKFLSSGMQINVKNAETKVRLYCMHGLQN